MTTTIYTCDQCNKNCPKNDLLNIRIEISVPNEANYIGPEVHALKYKDVCKVCCSKAGIMVLELPPKGPLQYIPNSKLTFDDMIRRIIQEEISITRTSGD